MKNSQIMIERHKLILQRNAILRAWLKWNKKKINDGQFFLQIQQILKKDIDKFWLKSICDENQARYGSKEVKTLEDLLV